MRTIGNVVIEDNKDEILKKVTAWNNAGNSARPVIGTVYKIEGHSEVKGSGSIGDWNGIALSFDNKEKVIVVSPNTITSRHYVAGEEKFLEGGSFKNIDDILSAIGSEVSFVNSKAVAVDKFQSTEKQYRNLFVCVKK
jgi:hypothetical protein